MGIDIKMWQIQRGYSINSSIRIRMFGTTSDRKVTTYGIEILTSSLSGKYFSNSLSTLNKIIDSL